MLFCRNNCSAYKIGNEVRWSTFCFQVLREICYRLKYASGAGTKGAGRRRWNRKGEIMKGCGCGTVADGYPPNSYHQQCPNSTICYTTIQETIMNNSLTSSRKITLTKISMISGKKIFFYIFTTCETY